MDDKLLGEKISDSLDVAAKKLADEIVKNICEKIEKYADDPVAWPLSIEDQIKQVVGCQRTIDIIIDKLSCCGIVYISGTDFAVIDVVDSRNDDDNDDDNDEEDDIEKERREIMSSGSAVILSKSNESNKMLDVYDFVSQKIKDATYDGDYKVIVPTTVKPIMNDAVIIKRMIKKLISKGYIVNFGEQKIVINARPDYAKMKKVTVIWEK